MKPQDVVVALALADSKESKATYSSLAYNLSLSASETHAAVGRLARVGLLNPERQVIRANLVEFLVHGLKYVFPATIGGPTLGVVTGAAAPIRSELSLPDPGPWVWPWPDGKERGVSVEPLYPSVPAAALRNAKLYELLALVDLLRVGRAREKTFAIARLERALS